VTAYLDEGSVCLDEGSVCLDEGSVYLDEGGAHLSERSLHTDEGCVHLDEVRVPPGDIPAVFENRRTQSFFFPENRPLKPIPL
jgi:hypothetical protein